ncbi:phage virion morphogenesis protein [Acinetobacter sp. UGAL515B_02]|nr:phage virion morphogenesis protein [Acinetobacter sp. UGAL515B_02]WON80830.1 phage virion morphogenesis protein [Acinetobacter sp. UGAL515B_02]
MQDNLDNLVKFLNPFVQKLSSSEMTKLNKKIGKDLRRNQQQRISGQKNPDGSSYTPRRLRDGQRVRKKCLPN